MATVLVTGASRGIGLEFARQYATSGWRVFATCREPDRAHVLRELGSSALSLHRLDVNDAESVARLARELDGEAIDILVNNAGVAGQGRQRLGEIDYDGALSTFAINALGPLRVTEALLPNVRRSERKLIVAITSGMGSIADNTSGGHYAYRMSKAALNMAIHTLAVDQKSAGIIAVVINPGWVKTDLGGSGAPLEVADSVARMRGIFEGLGPDDAGKFFNYRGNEYPW